MQVRKEDLSLRLAALLFHFKEACNANGYEVYTDYISVPKDTEDNELIQKARELGYIIQYRLL